MPTYAYACRDCHHNFEIQQSFSDPSLTVCPECGGSLRKVFNSVGVVFKGSGFYRTDSRTSNGSSTVPANGTSDSAKSESKDSKSADSGSKSGTKSTEGKPAKKEAKASSSAAASS